MATQTFLSFALGDEKFAIDVINVREVLDMGPITKVPHCPEFMLGVINVRGNAIPVIDLRRKFGLPQAAVTLNTRIVVLDLASQGESIPVGAVADAVHEVLELEDSQIEPPPKTGIHWRADALKGIGKRDGEFLILLDIERILSQEAALLDEGAAV